MRVNSVVMQWMTWGVMIAVASLGSSGPRRGGETGPGRRQGQR